MSTESRALINFQDVELSESTTKQYRYYLDRFLKWRGLESYDELLGDSITIENHIIDYLRELKEKNLPRDSVELAIYPLFLFYSQNRIVLNERFITKKLPKTEHLGGSNPYTTEQVKAMLRALGTKTDEKIIRNRAIIYFLSSSACRIGAIPDLEFEDLARMGNQYAVTVYRGTKDQYLTFLTVEASRHLDKYLNLPGVKTTPKLFNISLGALRMMVYRLVISANVRTKTNPASKRYDTSMTHSFRKRASTILKQAPKVIDSNVEKIMGHKVKLDISYNKPLPEILKEEYGKAARHLEIGSIV